MRILSISTEWLGKIKSNSSSKTEQLGLVGFYLAGIPWFSPLGKLYLDSLDRTISKAMNKIEYLKVELPLLHSQTDWKVSGRFDNYQEKFTTREFILSATAEEVSTLYARDLLNSNPREIKIFQISKKFRDEKRPRTLSRCKEFIMKDAYSFHPDSNEAIKALEEMYLCYCNFFKLIDLPIKIVKSSDTAMASSTSFEFITLDTSGEGKFWSQAGRVGNILFDGTDSGPLELGESCHEIGHIFYLGDHYSRLFNLFNKKGNPLEACSYGIGVTRLFEILTRKNNGLNWANLEKDWKFIVVGEIDIDLPFLQINVRSGANYNYPFTFIKLYFQGIPVIWMKNDIYKLRVEEAELSFNSRQDLESYCNQNLLNG